MSAYKQLKSTIYHRRTVLVVAFVLIGVITIALSRASGNATLSLSPNSGSYGVNSNFAVSVYENSGSETVNTVDVYLTYDTSKLQFIGVATSGSPFTACTEATGGGGQVSIVCSLLGGAVTGNQFIGSVTFKALAGSGTTSINFSPDSRILKNDEASTDVWNHNTTGGTYTLTTPVPGSTGSNSSTSQTSTSSTSSGSSSSSGSKPAQSTTTTQQNPTGGTSTTSVNNAPNSVDNIKGPDTASEIPGEPTLGSTFSLAAVIGASIAGVILFVLVVAFALSKLKVNRAKRAGKLTDPASLFGAHTTHAKIDEQLDRIHAPSPVQPGVTVSPQAKPASQDKPPKMP